VTIDTIVKSFIVGTLYIVELWSIDTSSDLRKMDVGEEKEHPSPFKIHAHNIVISNKNKDLGVMSVEVCRKTCTSK
jgi:hypothetical protein